ncbi:MAG: inositol monophosphatase family protein [Bacteroidota bacterium]
MNLEEICKEVIKVCRSTAEFIKAEANKIRQSDIETKGKHDYVTYVDKTSEKMLLEVLQKLLPEAGFIAEENTLNTRGEEYNWIVDPLDGTTNFIHGVPCYCISVALANKEEVILGVIYEINLQECFYAWKSGGAFLNGNKIKVSQTKLMDESLFATGFPYYDYHWLDEYIELFKYMMIHTRGVRRLGSAAADMAYVACGRFDGFYEYGLKPWDVAAGICLIKEAGGKVADFAGGDNYLFGGELVSTNSHIFDSMVEVCKSHFKTNSK